MVGDEEASDRLVQGQILTQEDEQMLRLAKTKFTCGICLSFLKDATMTPCGHMFCSECLMGWIMSIFPDVRCPKCRSTFKMEETIRMYNTSTGKGPRRYASKKIASQEFSFKYRKLGSIMLYEEDFSDSLSLKAVVILVISFTVLFSVFVRLIRA